MEMAALSNLETDLIMIAEKADTDFRNIDKKLTELEERTCNSVYLQTGAAKIDEFFSCQSHRLKEKCQQISEIKDETLKIIDQIIKCNDACQQTSAATDSILNEVEALEEDIAQKNKQLGTKREELEKLHSKVMNDIKLRKDNIVQYSTTLGLDIHHEKDKTLNFTFKFISEDDPQMPFSFHLRLETNEEYKITDCQPMVSDLEKLVTELNETNNFKKFVHNMRKEFCMLAKK